MQEMRRKPSSGINQAQKSNPPSNSLLDMKDRKRSQKSPLNQNDKAKVLPFRQRQVKKSNVVVHHQVQHGHQTSHHPTRAQFVSNEQYEAKGSSQQYNFKNLKNGLSSNIASNVNSKKQVSGTKEFYYPQETHQHQIQQPGGISINVNIQNMTSNKKEIKINTNTTNPKVHPERSPSINTKNRDKSPEIQAKLMVNKKPTPSLIENFECDQQLQTVTKPLKANPSSCNIAQPAVIITSRMAKDKKMLQRKPLTQPAVINYKQQIKKFEEWQHEYNADAERGLLGNMIDKQDKEYRVRSTYINEKQDTFTITNRATLVEWMMHVCYEFALKRDTFHIAVGLADKFFATLRNIPKSDWQLIGTASMFIASKLEEFEPRESIQFAMSTNNKYSAGQVKEMELRICLALRFNLNPPTFYMWANRIMHNWDIFIETVEFAKNHPLFEMCPQLFFRKADDSSYRNFRMLMQYIDCAVLDIETVQYPPQLMVLAFMYLYIGSKYEFFTQKDMESFPDNSLYLLDANNFNDFFDCFLAESFRFDLQDLLPQIQYAASFMKLKPEFDQPAVQEDKEDEMSYEDYVSFQTYNKHSIKIVMNRKKTIY